MINRDPGIPRQSVRDILFSDLREDGVASRVGSLIHRQGLSGIERLVSDAANEFVDGPLPMQLMGWDSNVTPVQITELLEELQKPGGKKDHLVTLLDELASEWLELSGLPVSDETHAALTLIGAAMHEEPIFSPTTGYQDNSSYPSYTTSCRIFRDCAFLSVKAREEGLSLEQAWQQRDCLSWLIRSNFTPKMFIETMHVRLANLDPRRRATIHAEKLLSEKLGGLPDIDESIKKAAIEEVCSSDEFEVALARMEVESELHVGIGYQLIPRIVEEVWGPEILSQFESTFALIPKAREGSAYYQAILDTLRRNDRAEISAAQRMIRRAQARRRFGRLFGKAAEDYTEQSLAITGQMLQSPESLITGPEYS